VELLEGKMKGRSGPTDVSTKLQQIAELASGAPGMVLTTLAHRIDAEFLREAFRKTRKDGAPGVDGQTAEDYEKNLEENLAGLLERFKAGTYRAPPLRRAHIPKAKGKTRPIGIPTLEDKVLQRAVTMVLEAIYEQDFLDCSYGFRPKRSTHDAIDALWKHLMSFGSAWVVEADIQGFFDHLNHRHLRAFLDQRMRDGVIRRVVDKWLKAGVLEDGCLTHPRKGTPQGGVVSPLLANVYLHEVLDKWFVEEIAPRLRGRAHLVRYADDFVIVCAQRHDAERVLAVLPKRFGRFGLTLHPEKTRLVRFDERDKETPKPQEGGPPRSFDFVGFNLHWGRSRKGNRVVRRKTAKGSFTKALRAITEWCRKNRHRPVPAQRDELVRKLRGHYAYFGVTGNWRSLERFLHRVRRVWREWLNRRSQRNDMPWSRLERYLRANPLPTPVIVRSVYKQRTRSVRSRMR